MSFNPLVTPVNTVLAASIVYFVFKIVWPSNTKPKQIPTHHSEAYNWLPEKHAETSVFKTYTPRTLYPFSGKDGGKILLAIDRFVFDVTAGKNFYGPGEKYRYLSPLFDVEYAGGMYGNFAGRDASRGMAKQSFDEGIVMLYSLETLRS